MKPTLWLLTPFLALAALAQAASPLPPVDEFLSVLDLPAEAGTNPPIEPALVEFADQNGLVIKRVEVPTTKPITMPPTGRDILRFELADTSRFDFVSIKDGPVIAVYPAMAEQDLARMRGKRLCYFDLSSFGVAVPATASEDAAAWQQAGDKIRSWREKLQKLDQLVNRAGWFQPAYANRKPYARATFDMKDEKLILEELDPVAFKAVEASPLPNAHELIFPIFPTVYSPASAETKLSDTKVGTHVLQQINKLALKDGDRILDVGTGSGYLIWLAWKAARARDFDVELYALDINPVAVANARYLARLAGYRLTSRTHDNVMDKAGRYAFPDKRFRCVIWNMPSVPPNTGADWKVPGTFEDYWDEGPNGIDVLNRFSAGLRGLLDPAVRRNKNTDETGANSIAVIWNLIPQGGGNIVEQTFKKAGFKTRLLEQYLDYNVQCVIYALH